MRLKQFKRSMLYHAVRGLIVVLNRFPRRCALTLGSWVGLLSWWLLKRDQHKMERHLRPALGSRYDWKQRRRIGRDFFINSGKNYADVLRLPHHFKREIRPLITVEGREHLDDAVEQGKGVIAVTGHIGNWELLAAFLAGEGYPLAVVARELYEPRLNRLLLEYRQALGITTFPTTSPPSELMAWLRQGNILGVLIDTDSTRVRSLPVPFFGRMANTPVGQSIIALRTGAPLVPLVCLREPDDSYHVRFFPSVIPPPRPTRQAVYDLTLKCTKQLEEVIRDYPAQWIWLHSRWRTKC
ncbi:MAG: hypothetical protein D6800_00945 [Candidatus Zixiibacteriota bacterium]|nr:MAG: hypothetical protein D6800_00945 [candidate division Zixibacteria bacterium]